MELAKSWISYEKFSRRISFNCGGSGGIKAEENDIVDLMKLTIWLLIETLLFWEI